MKTLVMTIVLVALGATVRAETAAVLPVSGINVAPGTLEAAQDVLRGHLAATGRFQVVVVEGPVEHQEPSAAEALDAARAAGAELAVVTHVARLGSSAQVRLTAYRTRDGGVYSDALNAASPDDLDRVLARLAHGLATGRREATVDTVTEAEAMAPLKRPSSHTLGLALSVAVPFGATEALPGMALFWLYDARSFLADATLEFHAQNGHGDGGLRLGAYVPTSENDFTPYLGGGARYGASHYDAGTAQSGITLFAAVGALHGRLGSVQLRGQLELFVDTFRQHEGTFGHGLACSFGIGF
jgi:hypothetical protein